MNTFAENDIKLPSTLKRINKYAFSTACKNIVVPNSCEYIDLSGTETDDGMNVIENITLPPSIHSYDLFGHVVAMLKEFYFKGTGFKFDSVSKFATALPNGSFTYNDKYFDTIRIDVNKQLKGLASINWMYNDEEVESK